MASNEEKGMKMVKKEWNEVEQEKEEEVEKENGEMCSNSSVLFYRSKENWIST